MRLNLKTFFIIASLAFCITPKLLSSTPASLIDTLKTYSPESVSWNSINGEVSSRLVAEAKDYLDEMHSKYNADAVNDRFKILQPVLINNETSNPAHDQFMKFYNKNLRDLTTIGFYSLPTSLKNATIYTYLIRLADWRLIAPNYYGFNFLSEGETVHKDWDGVSPIDDMPMPDIRTKESLRKLSKQKIGELQNLSLSAGGVLQSLKTELIRMLTQHATSSSGYSMGGYDFNTTYGINAWTVDMYWVKRSDFGNAYPDDEIYIKALNAWFLANHIFKSWKYLQDSAVDEFEFRRNSVYGTYDLPQIFSPEQEDLVKSIKVLAKLYETRLMANPQIKNKCVLYSKSERDQIWASFSADNKLDQSLSFENNYENNFSEFAKLLNDKYKSAQLRSFEEFAAKSNLESSFVDATKVKILAETKLGKIEDIISQELKSYNSDLSTQYADQFEKTLKVGGSDSDLSEAEIQSLWKDVKAFIEQESGIPQDTLKDTLTVDFNGSSAFADQFGGITFGFKKEWSLASVITTMLHEAHHAISRKTGQEFPSVLLNEGSATFTEIFMAEKAMEKIIPMYDPSLPASVYMVETTSWYPSYIARTDATYSQFLLKDCSKGLKGEINNIFEDQYGITDSETIEGATARVAEGTLYASYSLGQTLYSGSFDKFSKAVQIQEFNPFQLQACGLAYAEPTNENLSKLKQCKNISPN